MATKLKLQNEAVTQEMFDRLPALLTTYQTKLVTGFNDEELREARQSGQIKTWKLNKPRAGCRRRYLKDLKTSVAKIVGLKV